MKRWKKVLGVFLFFIVFSGSVLGFSIYNNYKDTLAKMYVGEKENRTTKTKEMEPFALLVFV